MIDHARIVITGVGLTCPGANSLAELRKNLIENKSQLSTQEIEGLGLVPVGLCSFDEERYLSKKRRKRGTRAGSIAVYCSHEALFNAGIILDDMTYLKNRVGIYLGITEHGNTITEAEFEKYIKGGRKISLWSPHHNPRSIANAPAGEVTLNLKVTGPHYTLGGACAAGNIALIHGTQMLRLREVDLALCGGVSEMPNSLTFFASFNAQGALSLDKESQAICCPLDKLRNGIVISEGGAVFCLERLGDALERKTNILGEIIGYHINSDATDFVNPNSGIQAECITQALERAELRPQDIDLVNLHATGTEVGDKTECDAVSRVFKDSPQTYFNCTKGFIGHAMGAAGVLELAGNLPGFDDGLIHGSKNTKTLDSSINLKTVVMDNHTINKKVKTIMNISFGMLGINSCLIVRKFEG